MKHIVIGAHGNLAEAFLEVLYSCHRNEGEYGSAGIYQKGRGADR